MIKDFAICPIYNILGIPCPGCGGTRAYLYFFTGHFKEAFLMHPLFLLPLIFLYPKFRKNRKVILAVATTFIIVYIIRFIFLFPDTPPFNFNKNSLIGDLL